MKAERHPDTGQSFYRLLLGEIVKFTEKPRTVVYGFEILILPLFNRHINDFLFLADETILKS
jgi:hypothetical protein